MAFRDMRWCRACTGAQCWKHLACMERRDDFIFGIPHDRAGDPEQTTREASTVKTCERVGPGFLTVVEFLHRKVAWSAEGFSLTHDPKHTQTLAMAGGFGFNSKKQLERTKRSVSVVPGLKTVEQRFA